MVADPLWRPFITADPFIFAATGLANAYTFTAEDVEIQQAFEPFEDKSSQDYPILDDIWPARAERAFGSSRRSAIERAHVARSALSEGFSTRPVTEAFLPAPDGPCLRFGMKQNPVDATEPGGATVMRVEVLAFDRWAPVILGWK